MGVRKWLMANLNKRLMKEFTCSLDKFFWETSPLVWLNKFYVPLPMRSRAQSLIAKYPELAHHTSSPNSTLLKLPNEILMEIYSHVESIRDAASLAVVDGRLFSASLRRFDKLYRLSPDNWAGDQVICLGKHTTVDDLPENAKAVLDEQAEWMDRLEIEIGPHKSNPQDDRSQGPVIDSDGEEPDDDSDGYSFDSDSSHAESHITIVDDPEERKVPYRRIRWYYTELKSPCFWEMQRHCNSKAFKELLTPETPDSREVVLCNLTKGEYVRGNAMPERTSRSRYGEEYPVTLCQALFSRILWSSQQDRFGYRSISDPIERGKWAGDRIELTTLDRLRPGIEWRDVSEETVERLERIAYAERYPWEFRY